MNQQVTFSQYSSLVLIPKDDLHAKKNSPQDEQHFRQELVQDARRMARILESTPAYNITPEQLYLCVGIEPFVTPGLALRIEDMRRKHIKAVLEEQRMQRQRGVCDIEKLSFMAQRTSHWARERAGKLAVGYNNIIE